MNEFLSFSSEIECCPESGLTQKTYDAERDLGNVRLGRDQVAEPGHGRGTVQHPLVHAGEKKSRFFKLKHIREFSN